MSVSINQDKTNSYFTLYFNIVCPIGQWGHMLKGWVRVYSIAKLDWFQLILYLKITCQRNPGCI